MFEWLGVDTDFVPDAVGSAHNVTPEEVKQKRAGMGLLDRLRHSDAWTAVGPLVPPAVRKLGVALVEKPVLRRDVDTAPVIEHLRPLQQAQTRVLEAQLGRRFDDWKTLWGGTA